LKRRGARTKERIGGIILPTRHCRIVSIRESVSFSGVELRKERQERKERSLRKGRQRRKESQHREDTGFERSLKRRHYRLEELERTYLIKSFAGSLEYSQGGTEIVGMRNLARR
jgi:hypothetical protein